MALMPILNYTTTVSAAKSSGEIVERLAKSGATTVSTTYINGEPVGVRFVIDTPYGPRGYSLPANVEGVFRALGKTAEARYRTREHAKKVAWRILKDWVEAQLALIEAGMSRLDEVMLPYMLNEEGLTVAELYRTREEFLALSAGSTG